MPLTAGIIGLPNVGKSTVFNAITKAGVLAANYPFCTIEPNVGTVLVPDQRLDALYTITQPDKKIPTTIEFTDIAGLVKGASRGEGLGNQFLSHIRNVDAIIHIVRCFEDEDVSHVDGTVNPVRDLETIDIELMLADLEIVEKRLPKIEKKAQLKVDQAISQEYEVLKAVHDALLKQKPVASLPLNHFEKELIKGYGFLTSKPMLYVCNIPEEDLIEGRINAHAKAVYDYIGNEALVLVFSAQIEADLAELADEEKNLVLEEFGITSSGLDQLIEHTYNLLGLKTFFTTESKQLRAWTFTEGMKAPACAGIIHTDFERGFIRAETIHFNNLMEIGSLSRARELGKIRSEGKSYEVQDGDVILFRFNV